MKNKKWLDTSIHTGLKGYYWYFDPVFLNTDRLHGQKPALYVGNHTIYGLLDAPLLWDYLHQQHGIFLRSLGDRIHFDIPVWRTLLMSQGVVEGSPAHCAELMQNGESILVFPGGAREVFKRKNEKHQLIWKQRTGFARLAIQHGYDIVPFAALGGDDCFDIAVDADDIQNNKASMWLLNKLNLHNKIRDGEMLPTLATGLAKLPIPRPERLYFNFGERISTAEVAASKQGEWDVREQVESTIEQMLIDLKHHRNQDRVENWGWLRKKLTREHTADATIKLR